MNEHNAKEIMSEWAADVAPISGEAKAAWGRRLAEIPDEHYNICLEAITNIAESSQAGHFKKNPNRAVFDAEYRRLEMIKNKSSRAYRQCTLCLDTGLMYMVMAMDLKAGKQKPVRCGVAIPSPKADVVSTPCSCDRGVYVTGPTFVLSGSEKSDPGRYYTKEQIERLAINCGYTERTEAEAMRQKCETFAQAWKSRYPDKPIEQAIGYKGKENKQVPGFIWTIETGVYHD